MSTIADFADTRTWTVLWNEVVPALEKAARYEFQAVLGGCEVNQDDLQDLHEQAGVVKEFLCGYVDGLEALHGTWGTRFSQRLPLGDEGEAELRRQLKQVRERAFKDAARRAGKFVPKGIVPEEAEVVVPTRSD